MNKLNRKIAFISDTKLELQTKHKTKDKTFCRYFALISLGVLDHGQKIKIKKKDPIGDNEKIDTVGYHSLFIQKLKTSTKTEKSKFYDSPTQVTMPIGQLSGTIEEIRKKLHKLVDLICDDKYNKSLITNRIAVNDTKSGIRNGTITCAICGMIWDMKTQEQPPCSHLKFNKNDD